MWQALWRGDQTGTVARKGTAFGPADDGQQLSALGVRNGDMIFLEYAMERENQAHYVEKDPFKTMVAEGELRQQGKSQWTLTNFLDYRSTKEFVLGAPPEPHTKFVQVDQRATQAFMNYMIATGFMCKRVGYLYGRWIKDEASGDLGAQVLQSCAPCNHLRMHRHIHIHTHTHAHDRVRIHMHTSCSSRHLRWEASDVGCVCGRPPCM